MKFEWDEVKAASNLRKHSISFEEASTAFADDLSLTGDDPDHAHGEHRMVWGIICRTIAGGIAHGTRRTYPYHQCQTRNTGRKEIL